MGETQNRCATLKQITNFCEVTTCDLPPHSAIIVYMEGDSSIDIQFVCLFHSDKTRDLFNDIGVLS